MPAGGRAGQGPPGTPGMMPRREDVIVVGAMVLGAVLVRSGFAKSLISEADILDGLNASQLPRL